MAASLPIISSSDSDPNEESALEIITANAPYTGSLAAALLITAPVIPIIATLVSIATYITWLKQYLSVVGLTISPGFAGLVVGTLFALLLWLLLAFLLRRSTAVDRANRESYDALCKHLSYLDDYIDRSFPEERQKTIDMLRRARFSSRVIVEASSARLTQEKQSDYPIWEPSQKDFNRKQVLHYRNDIYLGLMQKSTSWVLGSGYSKLWDLMDKAEESLIALLPHEQVIADAIYDEMRLTESEIASKDELIYKLRTAVTDLDADSIKYLGPIVATSVTRTQTLPPSVAGKEGTLVATINSSQSAQTRSVLQMVRHTINEFKAECWRGLIHTRNQLLGTMLIVGLATYLVVELVILIQATMMTTLWVTIIAFIGAFAGLFGRFYSESQTDKAIDDYRLAMARLMITPLLSGLAAIIGVLVIAGINNLISNSLLPLNFFIAAVFGLVPNLLINQLQRRSNEYIKALQSTQPTSGR